MNIEGKFNLFVKEIVKNSNKPYAKKFSVSIGRKNKETGEYLNKYMSVAFSNDIMTDDVRKQLVEGNCYTVEVESGFIIVDSWHKASGEEVREFVLMITRCKINLVENKTIDDSPF